MAQVASGFQSLITIDNTKVDATLTNYPIMVKLTSGNFDFTKVRTDGFDIAFYDNSDTLLAFETEYFDKPTSSGVFHVKIPSVSSTVDTTFKMKYGNGNAVDLSNKTGVWDSNFVMVLHMGASLLDSTANGNNGTNYGSMVVDGLNGKARSFDGNNDYINCGNGSTLSLLDKLNISVISSISDNANLRCAVVDKWWDGSNRAYYLWGTNLDSVRMGISKTGGIASVEGDSPSSIYAKNTQFSMVLNWDKSIDSGAVDLYKNGDFSYKYGNSQLNMQSNNSNLSIGRYEGGDDYFLNGIVDEVRISNISRSDAWILADDYNLRLNSLLAIGV